MNSLHGCTALITGASAGLGSEFASQLAPCARRLILVARRKEKLEELAMELVRPGLTIACHAVDLSNAEQTEAFLRTLATDGERVDFLVNNAGLGDHGLFEKSDWERVRAILEVNIRALTRLTHALLPGLIRSGRGAILNVSSIAGYVPIPGMAVYAATKAYVTSFTEALRVEVRGTGVTITAVCPGPVNTEFREVAKRAGEEDTMAAPRILKVSAERVVRAALNAVERRRARVVPGPLLAVFMFLTSLAPIFILRHFLFAKRSQE